MRYYLTLFPCFLMLLFSLTLAGCKDDDDGSFNDVACDPFCKGESTCNNGICACDNPATQIRPGFCLQSQSLNTFITYDNPLPCTDTALISFDTHPLDMELDWQNRLFIDLPGRSYSANPQNPIVDIVGYLKRPSRLPGTMIDSIFIERMFTPSNSERCNFETAPGEPDYRCYKTFRGVFTDYDTISGELYFTGCNINENPIPDSVFLTYPMTFHRLN